MAETITPVVHGGSRGRWAVSVSLHVLGAGASAAAFGAIVGAVGGLLGAPWGAAGWWLVAAAAAAYLLAEATGLRVPVPQLRRQVPDWWRTFFGPAPAAFLYGAGLGVGFLTYLTHGTLVVVSLAAAGGGRPLAGALLLAPFGVARALTVVTARSVRSPAEGAELVGRLARSSSRSGWRIAHVVVLAAVAVAAAGVALDTEGAIGEGELAAAILAGAFLVAATTKIADRRGWRKALAAYRLPRGVERLAAIGVPALELGLVALPLLGWPSTGGLVALGTLVAFSLAIVLARVRVGRRLDCGCFGAASTRDYRLLLARNAGLGALAWLAWTRGTDAPVVSPGLPGSGDALPVVLVGAGVALTVWLVATSVVRLRGGSS